MTNDDYTKFKDFIQNLGKMYGQEFNEAKIKAMFYTLKDLDLSISPQVAKCILSTRESNFSVANLYEFFFYGGRSQKEAQSQAGLIFNQMADKIDNAVNYVIADDRAVLAFYNVLHSIQGYCRCLKSQDPQLKKEFIDCYVNVNPFLEENKEIISKYRIQICQYQQNPPYVAFFGDVEKCKLLAQARFGEYVMSEDMFKTKTKKVESKITEEEYKKGLEDAIKALEELC